MAKARLRRGIELVKLANRIESLKMQEDETEDVPGEADIPADPTEAAGEALSAGSSTKFGGKKSLRSIPKGAIFREVVLAKVREMKAAEERAKVERGDTEMLK
jgi:calcium/calmodulin-dependent protein kinase I